MALPAPRPDGAALVTGASSGIGRELARQLAERGHPLVLVARRAEVLDQLAAELRERHGVRAEVVAADLAEPGAVERVLDRVAELGLEIDVLVNSAGFGVYEPYATAPLERLREQVALLVGAVVELDAESSRR